MTKADIVESIASQTGLTKVETKAVVEGVFTSIKDALAEGQRIELRGFGVFTVKTGSCVRDWPSVPKFHS